jgi:hypothetical protein
MITDRDRAEMRALCDMFRQEMARENEPLFDHDARARIGDMIASAVLQGGSAFGYLRKD